MAKKSPTEDMLKAPKTPSGTAYPSIRPDELPDRRSYSSQGVPIVLTWKAIGRIMLPAVGLALSGIGAVLYLHHRAAAHLENTSIHVQADERERYQSREQAAREHDRIIDVVKLSHRELSVEQAEQVKRAERRILRELRKRVEP